jgi:hypothetical protein
LHLYINKVNHINLVLNISISKLLLFGVLMCSILYAQGQFIPEKKLERLRPNKQDTSKTSTIIPDSLDTDFDPMDTVTLRVSKSALKTAVNYYARDSMPYDAVNKTVYLYGDAKVSFGDVELNADFITIEFEKNLMTAKGITDSVGNVSGKPLFKQAGKESRADVIKYNYKSGKGYLSEYRTKEGEGYILGEEVLRTPENNFGVKEAKYTTCEADHPHFYIGANKIKVIPEKKAVTGPAMLWIEDVPTPLVLPFGIFPLKRGQTSGIVIPSYANTAERGFGLYNGGYYFGLGEKADLRVTGDIYTNLSWALRSGVRYNNRYHYNGSMQLEYANNIRGIEGDPNYLRPYTSFSSRVDIVSVNQLGNSYLNNNSFNPQNIVTNQLQSSISYQKGFKNGKYNLSANARLDQNTATRDFNFSLPDITFTVPSFAPLKPKYKNTAEKWYENIQLNYSVVLRNDVKTKDSIFFNSINEGQLMQLLDTAARYGIQHRSQIQTSFKLLKFYTLSLSTDLTEYWYFQTVQKDTGINGLVETERVNGFQRALAYTPRAGISTRWYGMAQFSKGKIKAIRHVMTPTLDFSYSPDYTDPSKGIFNSYNNQQGQAVDYSIFEQGIFGAPSSPEQGNIGFGLDNNLEIKLRRSEKDTAQEDRKIQLLESIFARSAWNIFADSLNLQPISLTGRTRLFKNVALNGSMRLDPYLNQTITSSTGFKSVQRTNEFYINQNGKLGIITDGDLGLNANFNPQIFKKSDSKKRSAYEGEVKYITDNPLEFYDFNIPWTLNINYTIRYSRYNNLNNPQTTNFVQTLNFNGDVNVTSNWKVGFTSGYDIRNKQITFTSLDFIRQIHCWEFRLNWIPIGYRQSFMFTINVKSALLQDLKLERKRDWQDRTVN